MQYVRGISESVSSAWNSINPATLSGAIDVIVVEQEDGSLACSPFHVRFGKFSLLRPYEKKVEFCVNGKKQDYYMKLGEEGEAFFVFQTKDTIPRDMQTSPLVSPASSPPMNPEPAPPSSGLQEPDLLDLDGEPKNGKRPAPSVVQRSAHDQALLAASMPTAASEITGGRPRSGDWSGFRPHSDDVLRSSARRSSLVTNEHDSRHEEESSKAPGSPRISEQERSNSPPPLAPREALERAIALSNKLTAANIPCEVTDTGDLKLDMAGYKSNEEDIFRAEIMARNILSRELDGNYDIGALFGMDERGDIWIYSSEEAKEAAQKRTMEIGLPNSSAMVAADAASDPGYHSDGSDATSAAQTQSHHRRAESDAGLHTPPSTPPTSVHGGDPNLNYAKTLRLTSEQLKALELHPGANSMSFTVNRATCQANMYLWKHETPVVISDIDGTITKSDALGHVLNMIGRDWTHAGVAKLYSDIVANGYNIMYLTSRSVGQSDSTRTYLAGIQQGEYKLPKGPTILSPDRTMAALRREVYLRKPHVFKMATLRDIRQLYGADHAPFYAGYGNRLTDQISYRTVDVPRNRIFTINSNSEVSLDLMTLNKLKMSYININEVVDHFFPPVSTLVKGGGEDFTDFMYWRDRPLELDDFSASDTDSEAGDAAARLGATAHDDDEEDDDEEDEDEDEDDDYDEEMGDDMADSYMSRASMDDDGRESILSGSLADEEQMMHSLTLQDDSDADDEDDYEDGEEDQEAAAERLARSQRDGTAKPEDVHRQPQPNISQQQQNEDDDEDEDDESSSDEEPTRSTPAAQPPALSANASRPGTASANQPAHEKELVEDVSAELITGSQDVAMADPTVESRSDDDDREEEEGQEQEREPKRKIDDQGEEGEEAVAEPETKK